MRLSTTPCAICLLISLLATTTTPLHAQEGTLRIRTHEGWTAFEIATVGDQFGGWTMPSKFDGIGAQVHAHVDGLQLRVQVNHETEVDATISALNLDLANFRRAIIKKISSGNAGGKTFFHSVGQAYQQYSPDGGTSLIPTSNGADNDFRRFCSGHSYVANTFGLNRGFVDEIYITGEEVSFVPPPQTAGRLMAIDLNTKNLYQLSGTIGSAPGGIGGMPFDSWENAALLDTGETEHVALLLSADGGTGTLKLYIGVKNRDVNGDVDLVNFLAKNGLAYGSHYFLNLNDDITGDPADRDTINALQINGSPYPGVFGTSDSNALLSSKLEDVDTSVSKPNCAVLGDENSGLFTIEFDFDISSGDLDIAASSFSITKVLDNQATILGIANAVNAFGHADNLDWTEATELAGNNYPNGLIFVNEGNDDGEIWMIAPNGTGGVNVPLRIADTVIETHTDQSGESAGILDISNLLGYQPASILLNNNQGNNSSLSVLINPEATLSPSVKLGDVNLDGAITFVDISPFVAVLTSPEYQFEADINLDGYVNFLDITPFILVLANAV